MWFFTHVWIIPALMALSFLLILLFGKKMPKKGAEIGIVFVGAAFVLALITAGNWVTWRDDAPEGETEYSALSEVDPSCSAVAAEEVEKGEAEGSHSEEADGHSSEEEGSHSEEGAQAVAPAEGESAAPAPAAATSAAAAGAEEEEHVVRHR